MKMKFSPEGQWNHDRCLEIMQSPQFVEAERERRRIFWEALDRYTAVDPAPVPSDNHSTVKQPGE